ncbi:MAG: helix-turn-helix domain-containing protein [Holophagales bacterium]|nr:helix-turn-helix domain-containing protein [Holophagales bacterium]
METPQEFGEELRRERELREVTREQLAEVTKVSVRQIEALEAGRFELLPARVFARGFVLAVARHLGSRRGADRSRFQPRPRGMVGRARGRPPAGSTLLRLIGSASPGPARTSL